MTRYTLIVLAAFGAALSVLTQPVGSSMLGGNKDNIASVIPYFSWDEATFIIVTQSDYTLHRRMHKVETSIDGHHVTLSLDLDAVGRDFHNATDSSGNVIMRHEANVTNAVSIFRSICDIDNEQHECPHDPTSNCVTLVVRNTIEDRLWRCAFAGFDCQWITLYEVVEATHEVKWSERVVTQSNFDVLVFSDMKVMYASEIEGPVHTLEAQLAREKLAQMVTDAGPTDIIEYSLWHMLHPAGDTVKLATDGVLDLTLGSGVVGMFLVRAFTITDQDHIPDGVAGEDRHASVFMSVTVSRCHNETRALGEFQVFSTETPEAELRRTVMVNGPAGCAVATDDWSHDLVGYMNMTDTLILQESNHAFQLGATVGVVDANGVPFLSRIVSVSHYATPGWPGADSTEVVLFESPGGVVYDVPFHPLNHVFAHTPDGYQLSNNMTLTGNIVTLNHLGCAYAFSCAGVLYVELEVVHPNYLSRRRMLVELSIAQLEVAAANHEYTAPAAPAEAQLTVTVTDTTKTAGDIVELIAEAMDGETPTDAVRVLDVSPAAEGGSFEVTLGFTSTEETASELATTIKENSVVAAFLSTAGASVTALSLPPTVTRPDPELPPTVTRPDPEVDDSAVDTVPTVTTSDESDNHDGQESDDSEVPGGQATPQTHVLAPEDHDVGTSATVLKIAIPVAVFVLVVAVVWKLNVCFDKEPVQPLPVLPHGRNDGAKACGTTNCDKSSLPMYEHELGSDGAASV